MVIAAGVVVWKFVFASTSATPAVVRPAEVPADMRARLVRISELIESVGLPNVKEPHVRHVQGQLWEIRLKGKAGIARALYITAKEQRVVIVRAFIKKTEKTPAGEIELALQRAKVLKS
jgi:phage-related protein